MDVELEKPISVVGKYVVLCTIVATVSSTLLGYDIGVMSGALLFVSQELKLGLVQQEVVVGSLNLISFVGGAMAGRLSDIIGRRLTPVLWKPTPAVKRMLICSLGLHFFQQACGTDAVVYYSPVVFGEAGVRSKVGKLGATVGVGFCKFIFIFVATAILDRVGRKPLLLASAGGVTLSLFTVGTAFILLGINTTKGNTLVSAAASHFTKSTSTIGASITIVAICAYVSLFSIGFGPVAWVFISEIFPLRLRAQATGLCVVVNRFVSGIVALTFLSISKAITPAGAFFLYGSIVFFSIIFFSIFMPETKGKTLEELTLIFQGFA